MKIESFERNGVKIVLTAKDLSDMNLRYETFDEQNPQTHRALIALISAVKQTVNIDFTDKSLLIEAYPYADGGCILYMSEKATCQPKISHPFELTFKLPSIFLTVELCTTLEQAFGHIIVQSALYYQNRSCFLIIYPYNPADPMLIDILKPYRQYQLPSKTAAVLIEEYAQPLFITDAAAKISEILSQPHE